MTVRCILCGIASSGFAFVAWMAFAACGSSSVPGSSIEGCKGFCGNADAAALADGDGSTEATLSIDTMLATNPLGDDAAEGTAAACPESAATMCDGTCRNLSGDPDNCGACGFTCAAPPANGTPTCIAGACGFACNGGYRLCGGTCVSITTAENCGGCADADSGAHLCSGATPLCMTTGEFYACTSSCPAGEVPCGSGCVDVTHDPNNCGGCGLACGTGPTCQDGGCVCVASSCPACFLAVPCCRNSQQCGCQGFPTPGCN
ncbi:MAG: hypothetical protein ACRENE_31405 [Polyangiaceae bacterium]